MMKQDNLFVSNVFKILRFPLLLMVVLIHCNLTYHINQVDANFIIARKFMYFFSECLCSVAVPSYFAISGYLFFGFNCQDRFTYNSGLYYVLFDKYKLKLYKRIYRLLIPYFLWNLVGFLLWTLYAISPLKQFFPGLNLHIDFTFFLKCFWSVSSIPGVSGAIGAPIDSPMWFIRDLFFLCVFSPLIFLIIRYLRVFFILLISFLFVSGYLTHIIGFSIVGLLFFSLGAYCAIFNIDIYLIKNNWWVLLITIFLMIIETVKQPVSLYILHSINVILGVISIFMFAFLFTDNNKLVNKMDKLNSLGFFIFAFHMLFSAQTNTLIVNLFSPNSDIAWIGCYILSFFLLIFSSSLVYLILRNISPTLINLSVGTYKPKLIKNK